MLAGSYDLLLRYGNEYMDENPVVGEPGAFKLAKAHNPALASFTSSTRPSFESSQSETSGKGAPTPQPPPIKTEALPAPVRKSTKGEESYYTWRCEGEKDEAEEQGCWCRGCCHAQGHNSKMSQ